MFALKPAGSCNGNQCILAAMNRLLDCLPPSPRTIQRYGPSDRLEDGTCAAHSVTPSVPVTDGTCSPSISQVLVNGLHNSREYLHMCSSVYFANRQVRIL